MRNLVVAALLFLSVPAQAGKVGVLGLDAEAGSERVAKWTTAALRRWVRARGMQLGPEKTLTETKLVFGCDRETASCMGNAAKGMGVSTLVWGRVRRRGRHYVISLKAFRTSRPGSVDTASHSIPVRSANETAIRRLAGGWAAALIGGVTTGTLVVSGDPVGSVVWVDGKQIGPLPASGSMSLDVQPGTHRVRLVKDGYIGRNASVRVRVATTSRIRLVLKATARPAVRPVTTVPARVVKVKPEDVNKTYLSGQDEHKGEKQEKPSNPRKKWQIAFYTTVGVAAAVFLGGAATGIMVLTRARKVDDAYDDEEVPDNLRMAHPCKDNDPALKSWCDKGKKLATIANALYGTSAVLAAVAGGLSYWAFVKKYDEPESQTGDESASRVRFTPLVGTVNGLQVQLDF